jgi:2-oxoisovalerate dehydrogenase E1 component
MTAADPRILRYAFMKLARELDARFGKLLLGGRVAKWYSEVGNEATTVAAGLALEAGDVLCTLHRDLGAILAHYVDPARAFPDCGFGDSDDLRPDPDELLFRLTSQLLGRESGFSRGVERSFHYGYLAPQQGILHVGMISHLGAMIPVAAGCAFALKTKGSDRLALNFIGDGGTSTGDFHEGLNMAAVWKLPLILVIENNRYAFSTPVHQQFAAKRLSDRGPGYGIAAETVDGNDPDAVAEVLARATLRARAGEGPTLIEAMLGRMRGHSEGDDSLKVVPKDELAVYLADDPVPSYEKLLVDEGVMDPSLREHLDDRVATLVEGAVERGLEADLPCPETAHRSVFAPVESRSGTVAEQPDPPSELSYVEAIHRALLDEMTADPTVVLMGQDIGVFEGAFRVTKGLHQRWPDRVLDTPIAESGTIGVAVGASLLGYRPVVEMQFADFIACGFNQVVNVAAKLFYRWEVACPIVVRLPSGGGVSAGPFHSQNPEAWFAHVAGLKVVCPATVEDAYALLRSSIQDPNPVLFFEHKYLYRRIKAQTSLRQEPSELGVARVVRSGSDVTLIGYGASLWTCVEAAKALAAQGVQAEVIDLRTLVPLDEETLLESARKTSRVIIVHEAQETGGFGGEIAARIADRAFFWLDAPVRRVAYPDRPVPYAKALEAELLPDSERVVREALEIIEL